MELEVYELEWGSTYEGQSGAGAGLSWERPESVMWVSQLRRERGKEAAVLRKGFAPAREAPVRKDCSREGSPPGKNGLLPGH